MADNEVKASIVVDLDEKGVVVGARNITKNVDQMTRKMINNTNQINAKFGAMNKNIGGSANQLNAFTKKIAGMYLGAQGFQRTWEFNDGIKEMQRNFNWSAEAAERYKQVLFDIQWQYGVNKNAFGAYINEVARGIKTEEEIAEKAKLGAIAMKGLGLSAENAVKLMRSFEMNGIQDPEAVMNMFANTGQNRNGRMNADEIAMGAVDIMKDYKGVKDAKAYENISAILQVVADKTETSDEAVSQVKSLLSDLSSVDNRQFLKSRLGFDPFVKVGNQLQLKDLQPIVDAMSEDTKNGRLHKGVWIDQNSTLEGKLGGESANAVIALAGQGERVNDIKKSRGVDVGQLALERSRNFNASTEKLIATMERLADMHLAVPIEQFALALSQLDAHDIQNILDGIKEGAEGLKIILAAFAGAKALDMIKSINIKGGGTITMSVVVGKFVIDYLAKTANEKQDAVDYKNVSSEQFLMENILAPLNAQLKEMGLGGLGSDISDGLILQAQKWNKNGLYQDKKDLAVASLSWIQENAGAKSYKMLLDGQDTGSGFLDSIFKGLALPSNQLNYFDPAKNKRILESGAFNAKEGFDKEAAITELARAMNIQDIVKDKLENIELKPQQVDVKINVKSDPSLLVTSVKKESTVNTPEKLGKSTGGQP